MLEEDAEMYEGAVDVARHWEAQGYQPVYVTGRPYLFDEITREWLDRHALPAGPVRLTDGLSESIPSGVAGYKTRVLTDLRDRVGVELRVAYGNATTDLCAYAAAGIDPRHTYIIGEHAGEGCEGYAPAQVVEDYPSHLAGL